MEQEKNKKDEWEEKFNKWKSEKDADVKIETLPIVEEKMQIAADNDNSTSKAKTSKTNKFLIFLAFAIPIAILLYGLYVNYLPFGWEKSYELKIDNEGIISPLSKEVYITDTNGRRLLSLPEGVQGQINVVIEPPAVLKNATAEIQIEGNNVYLGTELEKDISEVRWNYDWDFSGGLPADLIGNTGHSISDKCARFDATKEQTLSFPNSQNLFESGPMTIYLKWKPSETSQILGNYQQLVGHYNWEIWQGSENMQFRVGRMNNAEGPSYSTSYKITPDFFEKEHELLAIYSPDANEKGYIELFVDGKFAQRTPIGKDIIYKDYNSNKNLNFGWTPHNYEKYPHFDGCLYEAKIANYAVKENIVSGKVQSSDSKITIPIVGNGDLNSVKITVTK